MSSIKDCNLTITPRIYQKHAYDLMIKRYSEGDRTFHIVAPPGSGKTVLGILLAIMLKKKTLVLSPNRTISSQWEKTFKKFAVNTLDENDDCSTLISSSIDDNPDILSITYQAFSVKDKDGNLHDNAEKIIDYLIKNDFETIILDECHHLLNYWAKIIKNFLKKSSKDVVVIGLTATLPKDKSNKEKQAYLEIMEEVDYQVPIPAVVKDGNLSPFRDFPYFVTPTDSEMSFLQSETELVFELIKKIEKLSKDGELDYSLLEFCEIFIENPTFKDKDIFEPIDFNSFYLKEPDIAISIVKYLDEFTLTIPIEVIIQDEMEEDISIYDYATLFRFYLYYFLENNTYNTKDSKKESLKKEILKTWKKAGYNLHENRVTEIKNNILKVLQVSNAKIKAVETILKNEYEILQKELTALVLTDFIFAKTSKKLKEIIEPESGGASGVFVHISNTELFNLLTPVMITGKKVMIHPSLKDKFLKFDKNFNFIKKNNYYYLDNPPSASKLLTFATELSYKGIIKLIIGTRSLLGEGYDNVKINTLIDLTVTSSYVSVNQIRGRALRKDPDRFDKVANIWEVISIIPSVKTGYYDLKRVQKKHEHFLSLSPEGIIEKGIEHLGIDLMNLGHIDTINKNSLKKSQKRGDTFVDWKIGEKYKDNFVHSIEFKEQKRKKHKKDIKSNQNEKIQQENISNMDNLYIKEIELNQNKRDDALKHIEPLSTYRFNFYFLTLFIFFILIYTRIDFIGRFSGMIFVTISFVSTIKNIIKDKNIKAFMGHLIVTTFFITNIFYSILLLLFTTITIKYFNIFILKREIKGEYFNFFYIFLNMITWLFLNMISSKELILKTSNIINSILGINLHLKTNKLIVFILIFIFIFFITEILLWNMKNKKKIVNLKNNISFYFYIIEFSIYLLIFGSLLYFKFGYISLISLFLFFVVFYIVKLVIYRNLKGDYSIFLDVVSKVIFKTFQELEKIDKNLDFSEIIKVEKKNKATSILVEDESISKLFINSINQLFQPIFFQKYVVEYQNKFNKNKLNKNYFPVPEFFGKNKSSALIFTKFWNKYISDGELIYIKNKKNYNMIKKDIMKKSLTISGKEKSLWM